MNKIIIKKTAVALVAALLIFSLSGCLNLKLNNLNSGVKALETSIVSDDTVKQEASVAVNPADPGGTDTSHNELADSGSDENTSVNDNVPITQNTEDVSTSSTSTTASQSGSIPESSADTLPQLSLEIIEGPVILEDNSLCYYRVKATAKGSPHPKIDFSKDDSGGAWGENIAQINLVPDETYELTVKALNSSGEATASAILKWNESSLKTGQTYIASDEANPANYLIEVNLNEQRVNVFFKDSLLRKMICSSGAFATPTPKGTFKTSDKIKYSWLAEYDVGAYYFVRFYGSYLFHSTPFDKQGNLIEKEQQNLGIPVSHGCVRIDLNEAKWFYETVPSGVIVKIY